MPDPTLGIVGGSILGGIMSADAQEDAAETAAGAQIQSTEAGIAEQRMRDDALRQLLAPYVNQGTTALQGLQPYSAAGQEGLAGQRALMGLAGTAAQTSAIGQLENSPQFAAMVRQGENAMLQNASATGGLRGGNLQAGLAQFRPQLLNQLIEQQYSRLGGMTALGQQTTQNLASMGQASAAGQAAGGMQSAANIAGLYGQQGAAQAGAALASGQAQANMWGGIGGAVGNVAMLNALRPAQQYTQFGTFPGSQQTAMLNAQMAGL